MAKPVKDERGMAEVHATNVGFYLKESREALEALVGEKGACGLTRLLEKQLASLIMVAEQLEIEAKGEK